jgi:hypothetical protein
VLGLCDGQQPVSKRITLRLIRHIYLVSGAGMAALSHITVICASEFLSRRPGLQMSCPAERCAVLTAEAHKRSLTMRKRWVGQRQVGEYHAITASRGCNGVCTCSGARAN